MLLGDAEFCKILEEMGCNVTQTPSTTRVVAPPDGILKPVDVDLSHVTDTFMTVAVVAAVASGTSVLHNIAVSKIIVVFFLYFLALPSNREIQNQRVKECDRIEATVECLKRCGIQARELPDGLEIHGNP